MEIPAGPAVRVPNPANDLWHQTFHPSVADAIVSGNQTARQDHLMNLEALKTLSDTIRARRTATAEASYTRKLLDAGPSKCAKKLGEEAVEVVIAATSEDDDALHNEAADLIYHLLVLLESRDTDLGPVMDVLAKRHGVSGLDEKAARTSP